ncbi:MAG TPA: hypothetical protein VND62_09900 [Acidimicrobiales bacterium]|nr:hypothetical protein [Acidimicrobiales bacterium]
MRHALFFPPFGDLADPSVVVGIARDAEQRGWGGIFLVRPGSCAPSVSTPPPKGS